MEFVSLCRSCFLLYYINLNLLPFNELATCSTVCQNFFQAFVLFLSDELFTSEDIRNGNSQGDTQYHHTRSDTALDSLHQN